MMSSPYKRTHRGPRTRVDSMTNVVEQPHEKHDSAMFVKDGLIVQSTLMHNLNDIETLSVELKHINFTSIYKPLPTQFELPPFLPSEKQQVIIGNFNSHRTQWEYAETNPDGDAVESWAETNQLSLIHDAKQPPSFNSGIWKSRYNPDIAFSSHKITGVCRKGVLSASNP